MSKIIKKLIFSFFLIYSFNLISVNFSVVIPINLFTIFLVMIFDIPAVTILFMIKFFCF